jgi:cellulose biosynthesis protein BcsQ
MNKIVSIKDFYKNIKGVGKVKELIKDKIYVNYEDNLISNSFFVKNELGEYKRYYKKNMFTNVSKRRDKILDSILE